MPIQNCSVQSYLFNELQIKIFKSSLRIRVSESLSEFIWCSDESIGGTYLIRNRVSGEFQGELAIQTFEIKRILELARCEDTKLTLASKPLKNDFDLSLQLKWGVRVFKIKARIKDEKLAIFED